MDRETGGNEALKAIVLLLVGFIFGFAAHSFIAADAQNTDLPQVDTNEDVSAINEEGDMQVEGDAIVEETTIDINSKPHNFELDDVTLSIADQVAGPIVLVSKTTLSDASWIAIADNNDGQLGSVLGAHWYPEGSYTDVAVELQRVAGIEAGKSYYGVIYIDDGDKIFSLELDTLLTDTDGQIVATEFRAF
jgi:hypothetical protein